MLLGGGGATLGDVMSELQFGKNDILFGPTELRMFTCLFFPSSSVSYFIIAVSLHKC